MLRSVNHLYGDKLGASDGEFGHVRFLFSTIRMWVVPRVVADTGSGYRGRKVLCLQMLADWSGGKLTGRETDPETKFEDGPSLRRKSECRDQYEEEYTIVRLALYWRVPGCGVWVASDLANCLNSRLT